MKNGKDKIVFTGIKNNIFLLKKVIIEELFAENMAYINMV